MKNINKWLLAGALTIGVTACDSESGFWDRNSGQVSDADGGTPDPNGVGAALDADPQCIADLEAIDSDYVPKQLLVGFKEGTTSEDIYTLFDAYNAEVVTGNPNRYFLIEVPEEQEFEYACVLSEEEIVRYAELNYIVVIEDGNLTLGTGHEVVGE